MDGKINNDKTLHADEVNKYTQSIYERVVSDKAEFGKMAEKNLGNYIPVYTTNNILYL